MSFSPISLSFLNYLCTLSLLHEHISFVREMISLNVIFQHNHIVFPNLIIIFNTL